MYTPPGLRPGVAVPLVVVLHGCNQSAQDAALGTGVNAYADRAGFVAVYPEQSAADNLQLCWNWFQPRHQARGSGEPAAIARITERVLRGRGGPNLDRNRVHVMGLSAGGAMAGILAATYPDLYASVGIHSAPQFGAARSPDDGAPGDEERWAGPGATGSARPCRHGTAGAGRARHRGPGRRGPDRLGG